MINAAQVLAGTQAPEGYCLHIEQNWWSQKCPCGHALLMHEDTVRTVSPDGVVIPDGAEVPEGSQSLDLARCAFCLITADIAKRDAERAEEISGLAKTVDDLGKSVVGGAAEVLPPPTVDPLPATEPAPEPTPEPAGTTDPAPTQEPNQ